MPGVIIERDIRQHLIMLNTFLELKWTLHLFKVSPESTRECMGLLLWACAHVHACVRHPTHMGVRVLVCTFGNGSEGMGGKVWCVHPLLNQAGEGFPAVL